MSSSSDSPYVLAAKDDLRSLLWVGKIFALFCCCAVAAFFGIVYLNTIWMHGYPRFGSPPIPGKFCSFRWGFQWIIFSLPAFFYLLPIILLFSIASPLRQLWARVYYWITGIMLFILGLCIIIMFFIWCGFFGIAGAANSPWVIWNQANDDEYCCVHYITNPTKCPNNSDCPLDPDVGPMPVVTQANLTTNPVFWMHWGFQGGFFILAFFHLALRSTLKEYIARAEFVAP